MFAAISKSLSKANTRNHIISRRLISKLTFCEVQGYVIKVLIKKKFSQSTQANTSFSLPHSQRRQVAGDQRRHQLRGESDSQNPKRERISRRVQSPSPSSAAGGSGSLERISNLTTRYLSVSFARVCLYFSFLSSHQRQRLYPNSHAAPLRSPQD